MSPFSHPPHATGTDHRTPFPAGIAACALPAPEPTTPTTLRLLSRHMLLLTIAGHRTVEIDFVEQPCQPGVLLLAHPGQAVRVDKHPGPERSGFERPGFEAVIITWEPTTHPLGDIAALGTDNFSVPVRHQLTGLDGDAIRNGVAQLAADCRRLAPDPLADALLRHQLAAILLRVALLCGAEPVAEDHPMTRFRHLLEQRYADTRRVEDYAAQLGCSVRTLTRASLADTGRTAKQVVDDRVALEAKRLLAGTVLPVADVGRRLGFPEPTNFGRFFHREVGHSPGAFRAGENNTPPAHSNTSAAEGNTGEHVTPIGQPPDDSL